MAQGPELLCKLTVLMDTGCKILHDDVRAEL